jgi:hypothetical protein
MPLASQPFVSFLVPNNFLCPVALCPQTDAQVPGTGHAMPEPEPQSRLTQVTGAADPGCAARPWGDFSEDLLSHSQPQLQESFVQGHTLPRPT